MINLHWQSYELVINTSSAVYLGGQEVRVKRSPFFRLSHCLTIVEHLAVLLQHLDSLPLLKMDRERPQINMFPFYVSYHDMKNWAGRVKGRLQWISQMCDGKKGNSLTLMRSFYMCYISAAFLCFTFRLARGKVCLEFLSDAVWLKELLSDRTPPTTVKCVVWDQFTQALTCLAVYIHD